MNKMTLKDFKPAIMTLLLSVALFGIHSLMFYLLKINTDSYSYSLLELYGFFTPIAVFIIIVLIFVHRKNKDAVGYAFMALTCIQMAANYFMLHPMLQQNLRPQKINFFILFALFLAMETIITARILNNKQ
ncbi:hypothetical protein FNO01nite_07280 [Flavobacterium noncentrifugens]|nr:hypothetical protein [Flavobacterium noncentrifugens]GEP50056.1 hypothetical protein FNO01nite_07280 [Flavobacterium noncentrifugens]